MKIFVNGCEIESSKKKLYIEGCEECEDIESFCNECWHELTPTERKKALKDITSHEKYLEHVANFYK